MFGIIGWTNTWQPSCPGCCLPRRSSKISAGTSRVSWRNRAWRILVKTKVTAIAAPQKRRSEEVKAGLADIVDEGCGTGGVESCL